MDPPVNRTGPGRVVVVVVDEVVVDEVVVDEVVVDEVVDVTGMVYEDVPTTEPKSSVNSTRM